jgi:hypothetical protein
VLVAKYYYGEQIRDEREWTSGMYWREQKCIEEIYVLEKLCREETSLGTLGVHEKYIIKTDKDIG